MGLFAAVSLELKVLRFELYNLWVLGGLYMSKRNKEW